jgi:hypothetical protein
VCLIYDPLRSTQGTVALKALRLTDTFMDIYRNTSYADFTAARLADKSLSWNEIFQVRRSCTTQALVRPYPRRQEIPVTVSSSALASAMLAVCAPQAPATQGVRACAPSLRCGSLACSSAWRWLDKPQRRRTWISWTCRSIRSLKPT